MTSIILARKEVEERAELARAVAATLTEAAKDPAQSEAVRLASLDCLLELETCIPGCMANLVEWCLDQCGDSTVGSLAARFVFFLNLHVGIFVDKKHIWMSKFGCNDQVAGGHPDESNVGVAGSGRRRSDRQPARTGALHSCPGRPSVARHRPGRIRTTTRGSTWSVERCQFVIGPITGRILVPQCHDRLFLCESYRFLNHAAQVSCCTSGGPRSTCVWCAPSCSFRWVLGLFPKMESEEKDILRYKIPSISDQVSIISHFPTIANRFSSGRGQRHLAGGPPTSHRVFICYQTSGPTGRRDGRQPVVELLHSARPAGGVPPDGPGTGRPRPPSRHRRRRRGAGPTPRADALRRRRQPLEEDARLGPSDRPHH